MHKKPKKKEIGTIRAVFVDLDPDKSKPLFEEQDRIRAETTDEALAAKGLPLPTVRIYSGGGCWLFWLLAVPIIVPEWANPNDAPEIVRRVEGIGRRIASLFSHGDSCFNIDRIARLPGTVNWASLNPKKPGRADALASVDFMDTSRRYRLEDFPPPLYEVEQSNVSAQPAKSSDAPPIKVESLEALPVSDLAKRVIANGADPDKPDRFPSRSHAVWFVLNDFARAALAARTDEERSLVESQAIGIVTDREWPISAHVYDQKSPERYSRVQFGKALKEAAKEAKPLPPEGAIVLAEGRLNENLRAAEAALLAKGAPFYERGGELVRPVRLEQSEDAGGVRRDAGATVIIPVTDRHLAQKLADAVPFVRLNAKGEHVPADPPLEFARHLMDRQGEWLFPTLRGVVNAPAMRRDGSILQTPGFDLASGLIFDPCGVDFPPIADEPSKDDALAALAQIDELFSLFPYERENGDEPLFTPSYSVTLSGVLSAVGRDAMRTVPAHANDSPTPGTGKTIQAETVAIIGTGALPAMMSQGPSDEELEKRIATALRAADRVIVIDNVERPVGGDFLCSVLTQERVQARILGRSERVVLPTAALFLVTGNNLQLAGDLARRAVKGRIDSGEERPDKREFPFDPRQLARQRRPQLVAASLTILRAYHVAGRPVKLPPMGSFEDYSLVRGAIVWLGRADPALTREAIFATDPKRDELSDILRAWRGAFGGEALTLTEAKAKLEASAALIAGPLYGLLVDLGTRGAFNALSIGKKLAKFVDRPAGGFVLRRASNGNNGARWRVERVGGELNTAGREEATELDLYRAAGDKGDSGVL